MRDYLICGFLLTMAALYVASSLIGGDVIFALVAMCLAALAFKKAGDLGQ